MPGTRIRKKKIINQMKTEFSALSVNEGLARSMVCAMTAQLDVSVDALADVRCAVSEAVTNAVVHGYGGVSGSETAGTGGSAGTAGGKTVYILTTLYSDNSVKIIIRDRGRGIADVKQAMQPLYTTDTTGERSGMGFAIMQSFMDAVRVRSVPGKGTTVELRKRFSAPAEDSAPVRGKKKEKPSGAVPTAEDKPETAVDDSAPEDTSGAASDDSAAEEA